MNKTPFPSTVHYPQPQTAYNYFHAKPDFKVLQNPVIVRVKSLQDQTLTTKCAIYCLTEGEVFDGEFSSENEVNGYCEVKILSRTNEEIVKPVVIVE